MTAIELRVTYLSSIENIHAIVYCVVIGDLLCKTKVVSYFLVNKKRFLSDDLMLLEESLVVAEGENSNTGFSSL